MKKSPKSFADLPPIRVRREPPTIGEAVTAAQDLSDDIDQQVEIAAGLIGLPADEVRPHVIAAAQAPRPSREEYRSEARNERLRPFERAVAPGGANRTARPPVIVERRTRPTVIVERRGGRPFEPRR